MKMRELNEKIKSYLQTRKKIAKLREEMKELTTEKDVLEGEVLKGFKALNLLSKVFYGKKISLTKKEDIKIYDEEALLRAFRDLEEEMDYLGEFTKQKVDSPKFKRFAKRMFETEKGKLLAGTEHTEKESLRVVDIMGDIINLG